MPFQLSMVCGFSLPKQMATMLVPTYLFNPAFSQLVSHLLFPLCMCGCCFCHSLQWILIRAGAYRFCQMKITNPILDGVMPCSAHQFPVLSDIVGVVQFAVGCASHCCGSSIQTAVPWNSVPQSSHEKEPHQDWASSYGSSQVMLLKQMRPVPLK